MNTDKENMRDMLPHIERAQRALDMLRTCVENKEGLSLTKRVPHYFESLVEGVLKLQEVLLTDNEYTERFDHGLAHVSRTREYTYNVLQNTKGDTFYRVDGMLPLTEMKKNILVNGRVFVDQPV
jgi:ribosomal protein L13